MTRPLVLPQTAAIVAGHGRASILTQDGELATATPAAVLRMLGTAAPLLVHAPATLRRLGERPRPCFDVLELWAFVRPARFCAPSPAGLARALGRAEPRSPVEQALTLAEAARELLAELADEPVPSREEALALASTLERAGWAWGPLAVAALRSRPPRDRAFRGSGLDAWARRPEWRDEAPAGEPGSAAVTPQAAAARLSALLQRSGLDEARPSQAEFAAETAFAFAPREREDEPRVMLAEAGTGVGKTLGYLAPASLWAEANGPAVWVSTYTRALQRQIERESHALYPDPEVRARKAVVRKGRENYACLLNFEDLVRQSMMGAGDLIGAALAARWIAASRDGDMSGGDWPAWLPTLFSVGALAQAGPANLVDRRGECVHAGCAHYKACFVEHSIRASRRADVVIANHALVLHHAAVESSRTRRDGESAALKRIVFDEGHHLFAAADSTFSACLSGQEAAELRRWVRGPEGRKRGRGLELRLAGVLGLSEGASAAMGEAIRAAAQLPGEGWSGRVAPPLDYDGELPPATPFGPVEAFLTAVLDQVRARAAPARRGGDDSRECAARPPTEGVALAAPLAAAALAAVERPLQALAKALDDLLDDEASELDTAERARIEGVLRGLDRRARMQLPAWRRMLARLGRGDDDAAPDEDDARFVDAFEAVWAQGRVADAAFRRNYVDPTEPLAEAVLKPAHGVLVTSATLSDPGHESPFALAEMRTGAARMPTGPRLLKVASPFDYAAQSRCLVVTDVAKDDPRQVAAAMRELFLAAGGGGVGLFTAIRRLREVHARIAAPLGEAGIALHAQHVDGLEAGALVDIFRAEEDSCLLGTDAVRDGVDVPGRSLRLLVFDRTPWPRPDLLHKARRERFGKGVYDDALARARIAQAFGRLIRRADDRGVFVMLDPASPTRLFSALPEGVELRRVGLVEAIEEVAGFAGPAAAT